MKIFLLFLFASFILGTQLQQATLAQRRWLLTSLAVGMTITYLLFDQLI
jgi:Flp pilus assembly protein protease CpaA